MEIDNNETKIIGKWVLLNGQIKEDENCEKITSLITNYLKKIAVSKSGWEILYQDPYDKRFWELKYLQSELDGGGPPSLFKITKEEAKENFEF